MWRIHAIRKLLWQPIESRPEQDGRNVIGLCNPGQPWSPVSEAQAVRDIRSSGIRYFVNTEGGDPVFVRDRWGPRSIPPNLGRLGSGKQLDQYAGLLKRRRCYRGRVFGAALS